jgi:hypothetical protein
MEFPKHFKLSELLTTGTGLPNMPTWEQVENLRKLGNMLDRIRQRFGGPIAVNSAFRSEAVNRSVGGSNTSAHLKGLAADIRPVSGRQADYEKLLSAARDVFAMRTGELSPDQLIIYCRSAGDSSTGYRFFHVGFRDGNGRGQELWK